MQWHSRAAIPLPADWDNRHMKQIIESWEPAGPYSVEVYLPAIDDGMLHAAVESGLLPACGVQIDHLPQCDARRDAVAQWLASHGFSVEGGE